MKYESTKASLSKHRVPAWFDDAKLGIFIHWGLYSVPAYAPIEFGDITETFKRGAKFHFSHNPYAEWYLNSMKFDGSPCRRYHNETYGQNFTYDDFGPQFNAEIQKWNPQQMAETFVQIGARYVVLTTKHHDGFLLWPSATPNPLKPTFHADRDIVGELSEAVKAKGLKMGLYYSGALDWSFNPAPIDSIVSLLDNSPLDPIYAHYADAHYRELIDKYAPSILWNDIGYPVGGETERIIAHFYNKIPEGVVNDRWTKTAPWFRWLARQFPLNKLVEWLGQKMVGGGGTAMDIPSNAHYDFRTPEYTSYKEIRTEKWECCRGLGRSFGYNRMEQDAHTLQVTELVHSFVDIVSKNGNLLLNIGPMADGSIPEIQLQRLKGLGAWLQVNGEAIFDTRPWIRAEGSTDKGLQVRFTQKGSVLYAILLGQPESGTLTIHDLRVKAGAQIHVLGNQSPLIWEQKGEDLSIILPAQQNALCATAIRISQV